MKFKIIYILVIVGLFSSCHKDVFDEDEQSITTEILTSPYVYDEVEGSLVGYVYDLNNAPVSGASVETYSGNATTNEFGVFQLSNIGLDPQGTLVRINKAGYLNASDYIYPSEEGTAISRIQILKPSNENSFASQDGGQFDIDEAEITFSADGYATLANNTFFGDIDVTINYLSPEDIVTGDQMNGGFRGKTKILADGDEIDRVLGSYGMVTTHLRGQDGESIKLQEGNSYKIVLPIPENLLAESLDEVQIWRFDEVSGLWMEGGVAMKEGTAYVATVTQTGDWMFADSYYLTQYCSRLINNAGLPLSNIEFKVFVGNRLSAVGVSDDMGFICSKLPRGEQLQLKLYNPVCQQEIEEITIGSFDGQADPEDIQLDIEEATKDGLVLCEGQPVSDAVVVFKNEDYTGIYISGSDGSFSLPKSLILCEDMSDFEVFAINENQEDISPILMLSEGNTAELKLDVCMAECNFVATYNYMKSDWCMPGSYDAVEVEIQGGSGEFTYSWPDGSSSSSNSSLLNGVELCVDILDQTDGCTIQYCELIPEYETVSIDAISAVNSGCQFDSGEIRVAVINGKGEYTYQWEGPNGFLSTENTLDDLVPGMYTVTVTDNQECTAIGTTEMYDVTSLIESNITESCQERIITIQESVGFSPYEYQWSNGGSTTNELLVSTNGTYEVTVTDSNGCTRTKNWVITLPEIILDDQYACEDFQLRFPATSTDNQYYYIKAGVSLRIDLEESNGWIYVPILESGYSFIYGAQDINTGCEEEVNIEAPYFSGLTVQDIVNTSCADCEDGQIIINVDETADCTAGCVPGEVIVINMQSLEEVTNLNGAGEMSAGDYYVIVLSEDGSCVIVHEEVTIE